MSNSASATQAVPDKSRFLVHAARGAPLNDFLAQAASDPEIVVIDIVGPRDHPHTALVELTPDKARQLDQQFRLAGTRLQQLTIEPDRPLFGGPFDPF